MATSFPTALDALTNPTGSDSLNTAGVVHSDQHANANDIIEALEAKVGVNSSVVTSSLDYRVTQVESGYVTAINSTGSSIIGDTEATDTHAIKGATTVLANSAGAALTVTQTGAGNAFVVEDSTSDSTPFVIDADGKVIVGGTASFSGVGAVFQLQGDNSSVYARRFADAINSPTFNSGKARGSQSSPTTVLASDNTYLVQSFGYNGTNFVQNGALSFLVDGAPSAGVVPGLFQLSLADSTGAVSGVFQAGKYGSAALGGLADAITSLKVARPQTGGASVVGAHLTGLVKADVTSSVINFRSTITTDAASFTLSTAYGFVAEQSTIGAGSAVTSQIGFSTPANLIGATNNYGFHSDIASGTGRWNFFANGTANNAYAGNSRFGAVTAPTVAVDVTGAILATTTIKSSGATSGIGYATGAGGTVTQATSKSTGVTLGKVTGQITTHNATLNAAASVGFTLTNSTIVATDIIICNIASGATADSYVVSVDAVAAGSCRISLYNKSVSNLGEALVINFAIIKGVSA